MSADITLARCAEVSLRLSVLALTQGVREEWARLTDGGMVSDFGYGMTENHATGAISLGLQDYDLKEKEGIFVGLSYAPLGVMGEMVMKIVDPVTKKDLPFGSQGEIIQKSPALCKGYLGKPEETQFAFDQDGWLHTGDIGVIDDNGFLTIKGRIKELIKVCGISVFPKELENTLTTHPGIENAAVIGVEDSRSGEAPVAFIKPRAEYRNELSEADVLAWCKENMSGVKKVPRRVIILAELPLNPLGKTAREELKKLIKGGK